MIMKHTFSDGRQIYLDYVGLTQKAILITNFVLNDNEIRNLQIHIYEISHFAPASPLTISNWVDQNRPGWSVGNVYYEIQVRDMHMHMPITKINIRDFMIDILSRGNKDGVTSKSSAVNNNQPKPQNVRVSHYVSPYSTASCFEIDTNFKLTTEQLQKLRDSEGVAWLDKVNPYKYRLMVADLFENCKNLQWVENLVKTIVNS